MTALAGEETDGDGLAVIICQGVFGERDTLEVENRGNNSYTVKIPAEADGVMREEHTVRYLAPFTAGGTDITLSDNRGTRRVEAETDGRYLVFTVSGDSFELTAVRSTQTAVIYWTIGGAAAAAVIIAAVITGKKRRKSHKPHEKPKDKAKEEINA